LKISSKISLGFGAILVLLAALSAVSWIALQGAQENFSRYRHMAGQMARMATISSDLQNLRMAGLRTLEMGDEKAAESMTAQIASVHKTLEDARARSTVPASIAFYDAFAQGLEEYQASFAAADAAQKTADDLYETQMATVAPEIERTLTDVTKGSANRGQIEASQKAAVAAQAFVVARASVFQYLRDHAEEPHLAKSTVYYFDEYAKAFDEMMVVQQVPRMRKIATATMPQFDAYRAAFGKLVEAFRLRDQIVHGQIAVQGPALQRLLNEHIEDLYGRQKALEASATAAISRLLMISGIVAAGALLCGIAAAVVIGRGISRPIVGITGAMRVLAGGDTSVSIPGLDQRDEVGQMAQAVQIFKDSMIRADTLAAEQDAEHRAREKRAHTVQTLTSTFEGAVGGVLDTVHGAVESLHRTAKEMSQIASTSTCLADEVTEASARAAQNVQTVAAAAEELSASIGEIARQVQQSNTIGLRAADEAAQTSETVRGLAKSVGAIGEVVALITAIADQTNLLALNATIEAARAGDAGKGFAVVANEVKTLATQTSKATESIERQIQEVQTETNDAVKAIEGINRTIAEVSEVIAAIASAVEEQNASTHEIAQNVQQAAVSTQAVSDTIAGVQNAASLAGQAASDVVSASDGLWQEANSLRGTVHTFLDGVRQA
jgi:methyl-accepting chemotaxis protein